MMQLASRLNPSSGREVCNNTNSTYRGLPHPPPQHDYLFQNTLQRTLASFRDHHNACAVRRKGAAAMEAHKETQRTDFLVKKYMETVRQQEQTATSVSIGLVNNNNNNGGSNSNNSNTSSSSSTTNHHGSSANNSSHQHRPSGSNSAPIGPGNSCNKSEETKDQTDTQANHFRGSSPRTDTPPSKSGKPSEVSVKMESNGRETNSSCSLAQQNGTSSKSKSSNIMRSSSGGKVRSSKLRQTSKELIQRSLSLGHGSSTIMDDGENDLTLTPDEVYRLGTPLKPLEEETAITSSVTPKIATPPSTSSGHSTPRSNGSCSVLGTSSPNVATPTSTNSASVTSSVHRSSVDNSSLLLELDAFTKVMNQVEQKEKAKERRASQPHVLDSASRLMSPPPYSMNGNTFPTNVPHPLSSKQYTPPHLQNCYDSRHMYQFEGGSIHHTTPGIHSNQDNHYSGLSATSGTPSSCQSSHLQHPPIPTPTIPAPPTSHSQLGALLQSPTCSQSPPFDATPINYSFPNSISSPIIPPSPYPLWDSQGMGGARMSQSFEPPPPPTTNQRAGQKRNSISNSSMYLPQTKIAHSTISHMTCDQQVSPDVLQNFQNHSNNGSIGTVTTAHVSSFPHGTNY